MTQYDICNGNCNMSVCVYVCFSIHPYQCMCSFKCAYHFLHLLAISHSLVMCCYGLSVSTQTEQTQPSIGSCLPYTCLCALFVCVVHMCGPYWLFPTSPYGCLTAIHLQALCHEASWNHWQQPIATLYCGVHLLMLSCQQ